jgi:hypothetical protein
MIISVLQKLELTDEVRFQPDALGHFRFGESQSPPPTTRLGQVCEWTVRDFEAGKLPHQHRPSGRREAVAASC